MLLDGPAYYFSYGFRPETPRSLPNSTSYPDENPWVTVPWQEHYAVPSDGFTAPTVGGWTFLYGPCVFSITAEVGLDNETREAQSHIALYEADAADNVVKRRNAWEWMVGTKEGNTVHLDGAWTGVLEEGRRLRLWVDLWHATRSAKIVRANIQGVYWRPKPVVVDPPPPVEEPVGEVVALRQGQTGIAQRYNPA